MEGINTREFFPALFPPQLSLFFISFPLFLSQDHSLRCPGHGCFYFPFILSVPPYRPPEVPTSTLIKVSLTQFASLCLFGGAFLSRFLLTHSFALTISTSTWSIVYFSLSFSLFLFLSVFLIPYPVHSQVRKR